MGAQGTLRHVVASPFRSASGCKRGLTRRGTFSGGKLVCVPSGLVSDSLEPVNAVGLVLGPFALFQASRHDGSPIRRAGWTGLLQGDD